MLKMNIEHVEKEENKIEQTKTNIDWKKYVERK